MIMKNDQQRILLYRAGALGDTLLTLPGLDALRRLYPDASLTLAGHPAYAAPLLDAGRVDAVLDADSRPFHLLYSGPQGGSSPDEMDLLFQRFDKIALFTRDQEGAAKRRLASSDGRRWIIADPLPPKGTAAHTAEWMKKALSPLGVQETEPSPTAFLRPSPESNQKARALLDAHRLEDTRFLALHPGSGGEAKCASPEALAGTARAYLDNTGARLLLIAGPADAKAAQAFRAAWGAGLAELYSPPLPVLGALLSRASAYLGCDSGVSHLAALCGAPSLVLFGPASDPDRWAPLGPRADWLWWKEWSKEKGVLEKLAAGGGSKNPREKIRAASHSNNFPSRPQRTDPASAFQDQ